LQRIRPADIGDVVLIDIDAGSVTTQFDDLDILPDDVVSITARNHTIIFTEHYKNGDYWPSSIRSVQYKLSYG